MSLTLIPGENCSNAAILNDCQRYGLDCTESGQLSDVPRLLDDGERVLAVGIADCLRVANGKPPRANPTAFATS